MKDGNRVSLVRAEDVEAIEATGKYMHLHCPDKSYMVRETLSSLEDRLDPRCFLRTHRSWIVAIHRIREVHIQCDGTFLLLLYSGRKVPVSRHFHEPVQQLLRGPISG